MSIFTIHSDGTALGTHVLVDEKELTRVLKIEIDPISPGGLITAKITVIVDELQIALEKANIECDDPEFAKLIRSALLKETKP